MEKLKKLMNVRLYKWLFKSVKPFIGMLVLIIIMQSTLSLSMIGTALASRQMIDLSVAKNFSKALLFFTHYVCHLFL